MKSAKILLTFALCAPVFSSCKKEYLYEHYNENYIEFENTTVEKSYEAQEFTVEVKTNAYLINVREQYTDEEATGWIKEAWFEEGMLHISIRENITTEDRSAEITLSARDVKDAVLTLVQKGAAEPGDPWKVDYAYEWNDSWTMWNWIYHQGANGDPNDGKIINGGEDALLWAAPYPYPYNKFAPTYINPDNNEGKDMYRFSAGTAQFNFVWVNKEFQPEE